MEKKKRPPAHEAFIECLTSPFCSRSDVDLIANFYGEKDIVCPPKAIPKVIEAFEGALQKAPDLENSVKKAVANLRIQLEEHEAENPPKNPVYTDLDDLDEDPE